MFYSRITPPADEPVTLDEARAHLRVDQTDEDTIILSLLTAAREHVESITRRSLITQTWQLSLPKLFDEIRLSHLPLLSVDEITYIDTDGAEQTLSTDIYDVDTVEGRILRAHGETWPSVQLSANSVTVEFTAGYGDADDVPQAIKQAILLLSGHWYAHREAVAMGAVAMEVPQSVDALLAPYRVLNL